MMMEAVFKYFVNLYSLFCTKYVFISIVSWQWILTSAAGIILIIILLSIYGNYRKSSPSKTLPVNGQKFPDGFLWSTGEDAYQHEGGNYNNDWTRWENSEPSPIANSDKCEECIDFYNRYEHDFDLVQNDFQNAHRIGIEWSRVEPEIGKYDEAAWQHYEKMLLSLKQRNLIVLFNLWHFTLPIWAADIGGWQNDQVMARWEAFVLECAKRFKKFVDYWSTQIDSQIYALSGYATGDIPPNKKDQKLALDIYRNLILAHSKAYHIIKKNAQYKKDGITIVPQIGQIYFFFHFEPKSIFIDKVIARQMEKIFNWDFLDAIFSGKIDLDVMLGPKIKEFHEEVKGTLDWIGVNYYTRQIVSFNPIKPGFIDIKNNPHYPKSDMDWEIYPEGLYHLCKKIEEKYKNIPIIITESGLADSKDDRREDFILQHLAWTYKLIKEGCPVKGFTYWSLTDNWEWKEGFWPKFGLYEVNLQTKERIPRKSAVLYREIARTNCLPPFKNQQ